MDFGAYIFDINNYNCFNKMPSNAKMQRKKDDKKRKCVQSYVDTHIMPNVSKTLAPLFNKADTTELMTKFRTASVEWLSTATPSASGSWAIQIIPSDDEHGVVFNVDGTTRFKVQLDEQHRIYHRDKQHNLLEKIGKDRDKKLKETFFFMHRKQGLVCWGNNDELLVEMRSWRKQRKDNLLTISSENNGEYIIGGRTYYTMVLQQLDADGEVEGIGLDPLAIGMGVMVDGMVYWFISKANRDAVVKYVMN